MEWMLLPYRRYTEFHGRSRRMEYWMFFLFTTIVSVVLGGFMLLGGFSFSGLSSGNMAEPKLSPLFWIGAVLFGLFGLFSFIPSIALTMRRFHDRDMSGWWFLGFAVLGNLPYVGWIASLVSFVITVLPGTPGENRFGQDPTNPEFNADVFS